MTKYMVTSNLSTAKYGKTFDSKDEAVAYLKTKDRHHYVASFEEGRYSRTAKIIATNHADINPITN